MPGCCRVSLPAKLKRRQMQQMWGMGNRVVSQVSHCHPKVHVCAVRCRHAKRKCSLDSDQHSDSSSESKGKVRGCLEVPGDQVVGMRGWCRQGPTPQHLRTMEHPQIRRQSGGLDLFKDQEVYSQEEESISQNKQRGPAKNLSDTQGRG